LFRHSIGTIISIIQWKAGHTKYEGSKITPYAQYYVGFHTTENNKIKKISKKINKK
jgi:hypothetical protein